MKSWILNQFSKLESYFSVSKEIKNKIDLWTSVYIVFICLYIGLWIEYHQINQLLTIFILILLGVSSYFGSFTVQRFKILFLFVLVNPLLNSLVFSINGRLIKLAVLLLISLISIRLTKSKLIDFVKVNIIINVIFCLSLVYNFYHSDFKINQADKPPISRFITAKDSNQDIYIIMLDGFPDQEILKEYCDFQSGFLDYLIDDGFVKEKTLSKYYYTDQSLPNIISGTEFKGEPKFTTRHIDLMKKLLPGKYLINFAAKNDYNITFNSPLIESLNDETRRDFGRGSDFMIYSYSLIDRLLRLIPNFTDPNNRAIDKITQNNFELLNKSLNAKGKQLTFLHFLTFHKTYYDLKFNKRIIADAKEAGEIGFKTVKMIENIKPKAKIIIFSDHSERSPFIKEDDYYKGILYIKN